MVKEDVFLALSTAGAIETVPAFVLYKFAHVQTVVANVDHAVIPYLLGRRDVCSNRDRSASIEDVA